MMNEHGITKIEILVVGLVVGVLGLLAVFAISTARSSARDAVRLSDVRQIQAGLELYFNDFSAYPSQTDGLALGTTSASCLSEQGFASTCVNATTGYMSTIGAPPKAGLHKLSRCGEVSNGYCYVGLDGDYRLQFELEQSNRLLGLKKGLNCATPSGFEAGSCTQIAGLNPEGQTTP